MRLPYHPDFSGKVAVVTGGAGILCREFCKALALCGAKVAVLNRTLSKAEAVVGEIRAAGGEAIAVAVNVTDPDSVDAAHQTVLEAFGRMGVEPLVALGGGGSDANIYNQKGIESVVLGTGMTKVHTTEETITVENLYRTAVLAQELLTH